MNNELIVYITLLIMMTIYLRALRDNNSIKDNFENDLNRWEQQRKLNQLGNY